MQQQQYTKPFYVFFLIMPMGISQGFVTVTLPFLLTQNGFPVALTAGIVAIGISANLWRFVWGPVVDLSLSLHTWYWLSLLASITSLLLLCFIPFTVKDTTLLSITVFISQVAATITLLPINGIMAKQVRENRKGEASGWYQAGSLAGVGIGGGAGLWLATHYNLTLAGIVLCVVSILFAMVMLFIKDIPYVKEKTIAHEIKILGKDILAMIKLPVALFVYAYCRSDSGDNLCDHFLPYSKTYEEEKYDRAFVESDRHKKLLIRSGVFLCSRITRAAGNIPTHTTRP